MVDESGDEPTGVPAAELLAVAARELIGAARKVLDAVEAVVDDPDAAKGAAAMVGDVVRQATRAGASFLAGQQPGPDNGDDDDERGDDGGGGVEFIKVD